MLIDMSLHYPYPDLPANQFCTLAQSFHLQLAYFAKLIYKTSLVVSDIQFSSISKQCFYFEWCNYYQIYQPSIQQHNSLSHSKTLTLDAQLVIYNPQNKFMLGSKKDFKPVL